MIQPTLPSTSSVHAPTTGRTDIGRDQFLNLLVTQLRNQDPLSPLQPHEFAAQLAQFSTVEQLQQLNDSVVDQSGTTQLVALLGKTTFSASLIGRQVVMEGNQVSIPTSGDAKIRVEVGTGGGTAKLRLLDDAGHEVAMRELGTLPSGRQTITLPAGLPAGNYHYELKVTGADQKDVPVIQYTMGIVDGVQFKNGDIILRMGKLEVSLDNLVELEPAPNTTTNP